MGQSKWINFALFKLNAKKMYYATTVDRQTVPYFFKVSNKALIHANSYHVSVIMKSPVESLRLGRGKVMPFYACKV